jgi:hypothetical protein
MGIKALFENQASAQGGAHICGDQIQAVGLGVLAL